MRRVHREFEETRSPKVQGQRGNYSRSYYYPAASNQQPQQHPGLGNLSLLEQQLPSHRHQEGNQLFSNNYLYSGEDSPTVLTGSDVLSATQAAAMSNYMSGSCENDTNDRQFFGDGQQEGNQNSVGNRAKAKGALHARYGRKLDVGKLDIPESHSIVDNASGKRVRTPSFQQYIRSPYSERYKTDGNSAFLCVPAAESPAARAAQSSQFWDVDAPREEEEGDESGSEHGRTNTGSQVTDTGQSDSLGTRRAPARKWTAEEDECLKRAVERRGGKNWKKIAEDVPGRNHVQCLQRYRKVLAPGLKKGHWSEEEDARLKEIVNQGVRNWGDVAQKIPGRTAKQCRERWTNHLHPSINKGEWTEEEDKRLMQAYEELGQRWSKIASRLPGRTENAVKIRWKGLQRKQRRANGERRSSLGSVSSVSTDESRHQTQTNISENSISAVSPLQTIPSEGNMHAELPVSSGGTFYETIPEDVKHKLESPNWFEHGNTPLPSGSWNSLPRGNNGNSHQNAWGSGRNLTQPHGSGQSLRSLFSFSSVSSSRSRMSKDSLSQDMFPAGSFPGDSGIEPNSSAHSGSGARNPGNSSDYDFHDVVDVNLRTDTYTDDA